MAKKPAPKPLFGLKHDFYESLDHALQTAIVLMQSLDQAIELGQIKEGPCLDVLKERSALMRKALMSDE